MNNNDLNNFFYFSSFLAFLFLFGLLPSIGASVGILLCKIITGEWTLFWGYVGGGIGVMPGMLLIIVITYKIIESWINDRK